MFKCHIRKLKIKCRLSSICKTVIISVFMLMLGLSPVSLQGAEEKKPQLCQGNYQSEEAAKEQLARFAQSYADLEQWKTRAEKIREGILRGAELSPLPEKHPLKPIIHSKRKYKDYTVENAAFESLPGVFVTGSLYPPQQGKRPFAGILCPHGHATKPISLGERVPKPRLTKFTTVCNRTRTLCIL